MSEKQYGMEEQDKLEEKWAPRTISFLKDYFNASVTDVRKQHLPYDLKVGSLTCDIKVDTIIHASGNFFLETESVKGKKKGWLYNTETDFVFYIDDKNGKHYTLWLSALRNHEEEIKTYPYREVLNNGYLTCGHIVPMKTVLKWMA